MATTRTTDEQKFWDDVAKATAVECVRKTMKPDGCARIAQETADLLLALRRKSIEAASA